jgi:hypothetical protein
MERLAAEHMFAKDETPAPAAEPEPAEIPTESAAAKEVPAEEAAAAAYQGNDESEEKDQPQVRAGSATPEE